ncbi:MAG TPA: hypothetical protein VGG85_11030 [Terracidiphilus sp.]|jgi:hypothetical protein
MMLVESRSRPPRDLVVIKLIHTAVWVFMVGCIVGVPIAAMLNRLLVGALLSGVVLVECLVLAFNQCRCPLTDLAGRCTDERADNFDIYLPLWLARYNKTIFGVLFTLGEFILLWRWLAAAR